MTPLRLLDLSNYLVPGQHEKTPAWTCKIVRIAILYWVKIWYRNKLWGWVISGACGELQPLPAAEVQHHHSHRHQADNPKSWICPDLVELGKVAEIHSIYPRQEGQRDKDCAD